MVDLIFSLTFIYNTSTVVKWIVFFFLIQPEMFRLIGAAVKRYVNVSTLSWKNVKLLCLTSENQTTSRNCQNWDIVDLLHTDCVVVLVVYMKTPDWMSVSLVSHRNSPRIWLKSISKFRDLHMFSHSLLKWCFIPPETFFTLKANFLCMFAYFCKSHSKPKIV